MASANVTKGIQKVKEAMSRMNKNGLAFCFVNLEAMSYLDLQSVTKATVDFKAGKDTYMCDGKFICLVSYEENDKVQDEKSNVDDSEEQVIYEIVDESANNIKEVTENRINIAINIASELYESEHAGYVGYGSLDRNGNDIEHPSIQLAGLISYLSDFKECGDVDSAGGYNYPHPRCNQMTMIHSFVDECPFKTVDEVMKRFYDLMRTRGLLIDDEEEDMGAIADAAGIEW